MTPFLIRSLGVVSTGSDVTPGAIAWGNISQVGAGAIVSATTNTVSITAIDTPITLRATWTETGDEVNGQWVKNGVTLSSTSPLDVTVNLNDTLAFKMSLIAGLDESAGSGLVTVVNLSDGSAAIDTFTYYLERI